MSFEPPYWKKAKRELAKADPVMKAIIGNYRGEYLKSRGSPFYSLSRAIVGQQISVKAADSVWKKVEAAVKEIHPANVLALNEEQLRSCGLSKQKVAYFHALANHFHPTPRDSAYFDALKDADIIKELTSIKGIGTWSAEMFLIFCLTRPDVFPIKDIGVQKAITKHYKIKDLKRMEKLAKSWAPYRTVATWYLWRSLDPVPVEY